jgi:hypothetical protein
MASSGIDMSNLSPHQQSVLQQYTAATDQEVGTALPLLQMYEWNVNLAIARFFDVTHPLAESSATVTQTDSVDHGSAFLGEQQNPAEFAVFDDAWSIAHFSTSVEAIKSRKRHYSRGKVHPLVQAYYDSAGNVTVLRERVQEYDFSHQDAVRLRIKKSKSGQPVNPPDKEFWVPYFRERRALI